MSTAKRGRRADRDNKAGSDAYTASVRRQLRVFPRRAREGELDAEGALAPLREIQRELDEQIALTVHELRAQGLTWQQIGDGLGMTRHAAYTKYVARARVDLLFPDENTGSRARIEAAS